MEKTKILIVEDEAISAMEIEDALTELGFEVTDNVATYDEALESFAANKPDILLTDIYLEDSQNRIEIVKTIQKIDQVPVIYLTAFSDEDTINNAAKTNPVHYLVKPFKRDDLKSTILLGLYKARNAHVTHENIHGKPLGRNYYFDEEEQELYYQTRSIKLGIKEKDLLGILVANVGRTIPLKVIEDKIWPDAPVSDGALRNLLYRLRSKIYPELIETIPMQGCRLQPLS